MSKNTFFNIVLVGAKSTGKTVYLTTLYTLPFIRVTDSATLEYLKPLSKLLKKGKIPATNAGYQELYFEYNNRDFNLRFQIDDYDGKFAEQFHSKENKELKKRLEENIKKAEGIIFFLPFEKRLDNEKIDNIRQEVDLFIEKIKELYPNRKKLPIPVVIAVTKWDNSPFFKYPNEVRKAIEYIKENPLMLNLVNKIRIYFSHVVLIPISSYKKHNVERPLEFCFSKTFEQWEKRIKELEESNDEEKLLCFLSKIKEDVKFYKNGKYLKKYKELSQKIFSQILPQIKKIKNSKQFEKKIKAKPIECLDNEERDKIIILYNKIIKREKIKKLTFFIASILVVGTGIKGYLIWENKKEQEIILEKIKKEKEKLYIEIKESFKNGNIFRTISLIQKYKKYGAKNDPFYHQIVSIENKAIKQCKQSIEIQLKKMSSLSSLEEKMAILTPIEKKIQKCGILTEDLRNLKELYSKYKRLIALIASISIDNLDSHLASTIGTLLSQLEGYKEYSIVKSQLENKLKGVGEQIASSNNTTYAEIQSFLTFISHFDFLNLNDLKEKLLTKAKKLKIKADLEVFEKQIENMDYPSIPAYVENNYKKEFVPYQNEIKNILLKKLVKYIKKQIQNLPQYLNSYEALLKTEKITNEIKEWITFKISTPIFSFDPLEYPSNLKALQFLNMEQKKHQLMKNGPVRALIYFTADSEKNEPLGFKCSGGDYNIIIKLKGETKEEIKSYTDDDKFCNNLTIGWKSPIELERGRYEIDITEKDFFTSDDKYYSSFELSSEDIFNLAIGREVEKDLGNGYHIIFIGRGVVSE